jgi:hypothetical protein
MSLKRWTTQGGAGLALLVIAAACSAAADAPPPSSVAAPQPAAAPTVAAIPADRESRATQTPGPLPASEQTETQPPTEAGGAPAALATAESTMGQATPTPEEAKEPEVRIPFSTFGWKTDFSKFNIEFSELFSGGPPKDGIPAIDDPTFEAVAEMGGWLKDREPVLALENNGDARAYPLQILIWHEIVNDTVGGRPVVVTYCPLCNTAIVFDATRPDGRVLDFGTTGKLRFSDLVMYDRQTESWWQQITGEAIIGELTGQRLEFIPAPLVSWAEFKQAHPDGKVLSKETGFSRSYGQNPYVGYDTGSPFMYRGPQDNRLSATERVATVSAGDAAVAFPFSVLEKERVVHYTLEGEDLVIFYKKGTASALDDRFIADSYDVGATNVFRPVVDGQRLTFMAQGDMFVDRETGTTWNLLGQAIDGPLQGSSLAPVVHANHLWFAWAVFKPVTVVYGGTAKS